MELSDVSLAGPGQVILALAAAGYYYYKYGLPDCLKSSDQQDSKSDYGSTETSV